MTHLTPADDTEAARIKTCKGFGAGAFLTAIPRLPMFKMEPKDFRSALRLRLGMDQPFIFTRCCCRCGQLVDRRGYHYLECTGANATDDVETLADLSCTFSRTHSHMNAFVFLVQTRVHMNTCVKHAFT
jgi:hypothetical protein